MKLSLPNDVEKEARDARRKEGLCIKCGAPDHGMKQCKNGYLIKRLSANKGAEPSKKKDEIKKESGKVAKEEEVAKEGSESESENE